MEINIQKLEKMSNIKSNDKLTEDIKKMNSYVEKIKETKCKVREILPRVIIDIENLRADEIQKSFTPEQTFSNTNKVRNNHFVVPIVVE